jgi:hypothetical protein
MRVAREGGRAWCIACTYRLDGELCLELLWIDLHFLLTRKNVRSCVTDICNIDLHSSPKMLPVGC